MSLTAFVVIFIVNMAAMLSIPLHQWVFHTKPFCPVFVKPHSTGHCDTYKRWGFDSWTGALTKGGQGGLKPPLILQRGGMAPLNLHITYYMYTLATCFYVIFSA